MIENNFKEILTDVSGDFGQIMILYKKLLFLNSCSKLLDTHNLRFFVPKSQKLNKDYLKSIEMRSTLVQYMKAPDTNTKVLLEVTLIFDLKFEENLDRIDVDSTTKFYNTHSKNTDTIISKFSRLIIFRET